MLLPSSHFTADLGIQNPSQIRATTSPTSSSIFLINCTAHTFMSSSLLFQLQHTPGYSFLGTPSSSIPSHLHCFFLASCFKNAVPPLRLETSNSAEKLSLRCQLYTSPVLSSMFPQYSTQNSLRAQGTVIPGSCVCLPLRQRSLGAAITHSTLYPLVFVSRRKEEGFEIIRQMQYGSKFFP